MKPISEEKKEEIRELHKQGLNYRQIAAITGVSAASVSNVFKNRTTPEQNKILNIPEKTRRELECMHERYGENGTHRAKNRLRTGRKKNESYCKCKRI